MTDAEYLACTDPLAMLEFFQRPAARPLGPDRPMLSERKLRLWVEACRAQSGQTDRAWGNYDLDAAPARAGTLHLACERWARCDQSVMPADPLPARAALLRDIAGNPFRAVVLPPGPPCKRCRGKGEVGVMMADGYGGDYKTVYGTCSACKGTRHQCCPWLTPQVLSLASAAYDERPGRKCERCKSGVVPVGEGWDTRPCPDCNATGRIEDGTLDPLTLAALADALEEAGCPLEVECPCVESARQNGTRSIACERCWFTYSLPHPLLAHLRSPGTHWRGCWALDLVLGKS